jgi:hypothetical protein
MGHSGEEANSVAETQKTVKRLKKAKKALASAEDGDKAKLEQAVHKADVDWHYTEFYPLGAHYVNLFPRKTENDENEDEAEDTVRGNLEMRARIEKAMKEGKAALQTLKSELTIVESETIVEEGGQNTGVGGEDDDDDDDGFFE